MWIVYVNFNGFSMLQQSHQKQKRKKKQNANRIHFNLVHSFKLIMIVAVCLYAMISHFGRFVYIVGILRLSMLDNFAFFFFLSLRLILMWTTQISSINIDMTKIHKHLAQVTYLLLLLVQPTSAPTNKNCIFIVLLLIHSTLCFVVPLSLSLAIFLTLPVYFASYPA